MGYLRPAVIVEARDPFFISLVRGPLLSVFQNNFACPRIPGSYEYVPSQMRIISKSALLLGLSFLLIGIGIAIRQHHWYSISSLCHLSTDQSFELEFMNTLGFNQVRASDIKIQKLSKDTSITSRASSVTFPIGSRLKFQYNEKFLISTVV